MKILAVGNPAYGDDGVGAEVLKEIERRGSFPDADLVDLGPDALALLEHLDSRARTVVIDAAHMGLRPGECVAFHPREVRMRIRDDRLSLHGLGLAEAFALAEGLGRMPASITVVGVEPGCLGPREGLSEAVRLALPRVLSLIQAEVQGDGGQDDPRDRR